MNLTKCKKIVGIHLSSHLSNANIIKNKLYSNLIVVLLHQKIMVFKNIQSYKELLN